MYIEKVKEAIRLMKECEDLSQRERANKFSIFLGKNMDDVDLLLHSPNIFLYFIDLIEVTPEMIEKLRTLGEYSYILEKSNDKFLPFPSPLSKVELKYVLKNISVYIKNKYEIDPTVYISSDCRLNLALEYVYNYYGPGMSPYDSIDITNLEDSNECLAYGILSNLNCLMYITKPMSYDDEESVICYIEEIASPTVAENTIKKFIARLKELRKYDRRTS